MRTKHRNLKREILLGFKVTLIKIKATSSIYKDLQLIFDRRTKAC